MTEESKDILGQILWVAMFFTPLITIPVAWVVFKIKKVFRIIIGLVLAVFICSLLYQISLSIIFRHGMG